MAVIMAVGLASCSNDTHNATPQHGFVTVEMSRNGMFSMADGTTFATPDDQLPTPADMAMTMTMDDSDGRYTNTWPSMTGYDATQSLMCGTYTVELSTAGVNGGPAFSGSETLTLAPGEHATATVTCTPTDALVRLKTTAGTTDTGIALTGVMLHGQADDYRHARADGTIQNIYLHPGVQNFYAELADASGRQLTVALGATTHLPAAHGTDLAVDVQGNDIVAVCGGTSATLTVDPAIFDAPAPQIAAVGFTPGVSVDVNEGVTLDQPVKMDVSSGRQLEHVYLTVKSPILNTVDAPGEYDLLHLSDTDRAYLAESGLKYDLTDDGHAMAIDFTTTLETMAGLTTSSSTFAVMAQNVAGVCSDIVSLAVNTRAVTFVLSELSTAVMGVDTVTMLIDANTERLERPDFAIHWLDAPDGTAMGSCPIVDWAKTGESSLLVTFTVPAGDKPLPIAVDYLDMRRATATVDRSCPPFSLLVDAFATTAIVQVQAPTPAQAAAVVEYGTFTANGTRASIWHRYADHGTLVINGLSASSKYTLAVNLAGRTGLGSVTCHTESDLQPPMANFDDWRVLYDVKGLKQGGRYATAPLSIVNRQNFTDVHVQWCKDLWTSNNAKTFDTGSRNHNTWYIWPAAELENGVAENVKAIRLTSVGWDHDGPPIADYVPQDPNERVEYSQVVPQVGHRSAGRVWLGSYEYDKATGREVYVQGHPFHSRPTALNGYFKYLPDLTHNNDCGYVEISIINRTAGTETVIAHGRMEFQTTPDYRAFSVPLEYEYFDLHATELRIMFSSSVATGDQEYEDAHVPLTAWPELGRMSGSTLWVSGLTFSY